MDIVLASASPRRLELLAQIGIKPQAVIPADIDETPQKNEKPRAYVERMAIEKASAVDSRYPVLAADTSVIIGTQILGKPNDAHEAAAMLARLSGRRHRVISAVAVKTATIRMKSVETIIRFKRLSQSEIDDYLASLEWQGKAGGYAIQGRAAVFVNWMSGSYSGVVGLPLYETQILLGNLHA